MDLLLAIRRNSDIATLPLERKTKSSLGDKFDALRMSFLNKDTTIHDYEPAFSPEPGDLLKLKYKLPDSLWSCQRSLPRGTPSLESATLKDEGIRAIVAVECGDHSRFMFQAIDNRYLVQPSKVAFLFDKVFQLNDSVGIAFPDRIDAIHENGYLYFRSELVVRRFLDIEEYFTKATDESLETYFSGAGFAEADIASIKAIANDPLRRKLHGIITSGRPIVPKVIDAIAKRVKVPIKMKDGKLVVPTTLVPRIH